MALTSRNEGTPVALIEHGRGRAECLLRRWRRPRRDYGARAGVLVRPAASTGPPPDSRSLIVDDAAVAPWARARHAISLDRLLRDIDCMRGCS